MKKEEITLGSQLESYLKHKIYEYACVEESKTIKKLREEMNRLNKEVDEYKQTLGLLKYDDENDDENDILYFLCNTCYHLKDVCTRCQRIFPCSWCQGSGYKCTCVRAMNEIKK